MLQRLIRRESLLIFRKVLRLLPLYQCRIGAGDAAESSRKFVGKKNGKIWAKFGKN